MNKAVFLDRDGTINVDKHYLYRVKDFEFLPGAIEGMKAFQDAGYLLIVITNQSGIARGYYTEENYNILTNYMKSELEKKGVFLTDVLYCPHHPEAIIPKYKKECECRKPKLGLFFEAINKWDIDVNESVAIGDKMRDLMICRDTCCHPFLIENFKNSWDENLKKITVVSSINEAANMII